VMLDPTYPPAGLIDRLRLAPPRAWLAIAAAGAPAPELVAHLDGLEASGDLAFRFALPGGGPAALLGALPPAAPAAPVAVGPDDVACIGFTSGSTGTPKAIVGRHGPLTHFLRFQAACFGLTADDRYSLLSGLAHDPLQRDLF